MSESNKRILMCGDWHGNSEAAIHAFETAKELGITVLIHLGDFGYNFDGARSEDFDEVVLEGLKENELQLIWIDGNHDNHGWLKTIADQKPEGLVIMDENERLFWAPRGSIWDLGDKKFGALGGAFSLNREDLDEGKTMFSELEEPTEEQASNLFNAELDILLTHDAPSEVYLKSFIPTDDPKAIRGNNTRSLISRIIDSSKPDLVFTGHWHQRKKSVYPTRSDHFVEVHVLDQQHKDGNLAILHLETMTVTHIDEDI